tara:strand:+ start:1283 stop:3145 length:1863 start_codon:yes stop_codon:yes gene_type:complete
VAEAVVKLRVDATNANKALNGVQAKTQKLQSSLGGLKTAIGGIGLTLLARQAINTSANFEKLNVRLGLLTKANGTFAKSQQIAADAQKAFGLSATEALEGITDITARLAPLGVGVEDIKSTFFGFNTAAKLAGASAIESSNAFRQLAQALGSGRLAGDEFRSISEQIPTLLAPIADELNVPIGKLKELAAEGKLTSDVVLRALRKIETDGGASLKALIENDPTQVFKDFNNATEDLSRAFGDQLKPVVVAVTKALTEFIIKITEFVNTDAGKASMILLGIAAALKAITVAAPLAAAAVAAFTVKVGALKIAVLGLSGALAASGIGAFALALGFVTTKIIQAKREQKELNDAIKEGSKEQVNKEMEKQQKILDKINKQLEKGRVINRKELEFKKQLIEKNIVELENRNQVLEKETEITGEKKKQNEQNKKTEESLKKQQEATDKLKEKITAVGEEIENNIKNNLRDAITGAKSFGEAMAGVLNKIRDKLLDLAIDQAIGGIGGFFSKAIGGLFGVGGGKLDKTFGAPMLAPVSGLKFADGGRPPVGRASLVGERGPELFVPDRAGTIIPNNAMGSTNIVINVDATNSNVQSDGDGQQFGQALATAVQLEIVKQKRSGGLLT